MNEIGVNFFLRPGPAGSHRDPLGGRFSVVHLHVRVQRALLLVALPTNLAPERFLAGVREHVSLQVDLLDEAFAAELADERFLLLVEPLVRLQ